MPWWYCSHSRKVQKYGNMISLINHPISNIMVICIIILKIMSITLLPHVQIHDISTAFLYKNNDKYHSTKLLPY